jgi:hypothetical protein
MLHARSDYQDRIVDTATENAIPDDEPVFLLRAQDRTAADCLRYWIKLNKALITADKKAGKEITPGRRKALVLAEAHAYKMDEWDVKKTADVAV